MMMSLVKVALAMDEAQMFGQVKLNIELRPDNLNAFSKIGSFPLSLLANIAMIAVFLGVMYYLFPIVRQTVFGVKRSENNGQKVNRD